MLGSVGKYRLDQRLGGGGMAEVFLAATQGAEGFSRKVAIKRVLPGFSDNPAFAQMFVAEAQISSRLQHPNIVSVLDFDRDAEQRLYLVMELVEGKDLDALASTGLLPYPVLIFVIAEVLRGLGYAHDLPAGGAMRGIVHRDVSPHNVLLSWEGAVKVSDFGIAKARSASEATASVFIKGKPAYMSPEQANGQPLDGRSDLFAVGVMMWEMLVGRRLFVGEDTRATLAAVLFGQVPRPRAIRGDVPKDVERVAMKLLERDVAARYPTAEAAIADLLDCADAPKDGRELVARVLAERFPQQAPVRNSILRVRSTPPQPQAAHDRVTIPDGSVGRMPTPTPMPAAVVPAASVSSVMDARTGTLGHAPARGNGGKIAIIAAITVASGALTFGIVKTMSGSKSAGSGSAVVVGSGSATAAGSAAAGSATAGVGSAAVAATVTPDAGVAAATTVIADAAVAEAPVGPDASGSGAGSAASTSVTVAPRKSGRLVVHAFPALTVYVDGHRVADTPLERNFPVGKHLVRLVNVETKHDEKVTVQITESKPVVLERF